MGFFKSIKDMKTVVAAAPGMIQQSQVLSAQAQQLAAAQQQQVYAQQQQAMANAQAHGVAPVAGEDIYAPIAGVTVEQYAKVAKGLGAYNYDQAMAPTLAAQLGISRENWETAAAGFNARVTASPAFAQHFNALWRQA